MIKETYLRLSDEEAKFLLVVLTNNPDPLAVAIHARLTAAIVEEVKKPDEDTYIVKKGDTLWGIAEKKYGRGKGKYYHIIFEANKPPLTNPDMIQPGQVLKIPPLPSQHPS